MMPLVFEIDFIFNVTHGSLFWGTSLRMADSCHKRRVVSFGAGLKNLRGLGRCARGCFRLVAEREISEARIPAWAVKVWIEGI